MAGIADASSTRRERDVARLLEFIEQHGHRNGREPGENQCDNKNPHGIPPDHLFLLHFMGVGTGQGKLSSVAL
jgi:hypothetical protein